MLDETRAHSKDNSFHEPCETRYAAIDAQKAACVQRTLVKLCKTT